MSGEPLDSYEKKILASVARLWGLAMEKKYSHAIKREWGEFMNLLAEYFAEVKRLISTRRK